MRYFLKVIIWIVLIATGLLLGINLLAGFLWWKIIIFAIACYLIGHGAYKLLRLIDKYYTY